MSESRRPSDASGPPEAEVKMGRRISAVWIFPIVAVLIGGWLVYKTLSEKGPEITVVFETASGLEPGKTQVKYREVVVGTVASVALDPVARTITATAEMDKTAEPLLTETTRFWVVRPRFGVKEISGLGTLVSGAYVELDPGAGGDAKRDFTALEDPPVIRADTPGTEIVLATSNLGSLSRGSPLYFKGIEVGEVLGYELTEDKNQIFVHVFVTAPHDQLVRRTTRFWNVSGIEVSMGAGGMKLKTGTLQSLVLGGIEFETPDLLGSGEPVPEGTHFTLFENREEIRETAYTEKSQFIMYFDSSVRGLGIGAPVEFRGIKVGSVLDVRLELDPETVTFLIPVLVEIELERVSVFDRSIVGPQLPMEQRRANIERMISRGLRARLKTGSFLTGQLIIDLDMLPDAPINLVGANSDYLEIPTLPASLEEITNSVTDLVAKLQKLPLDTISEKVISTLDGTDRLVNSDEVRTAVKSLSDASSRLESLLANVDEKVIPQAAIALDQAGATLKEAESAMVSAQKALESIDSVVAEESPLRYDTHTAIQAISAAARSIRQFTEFLQRNPSALLTGKSPQ